MRRICIIGGGQAGLILAHSLVRADYDVTLYSDRTPDQWINESRPTGTAYLFAESLDIERKLGIEHWSQTMHAGQGMHLHLASPAGREPLVVAGRAKRPGAAVDQRLKFHHWMHDLEKRGGKIVIESVTTERADSIAAEADLTILAAGKGELGRLIPRDPLRSVYDKPQRRLAMVIVRDVKGWSHQTGFTAVKYSALGPLGEIFWVPFTHKTEGSTWSAIVEARPNGALDIFGDCTSGEMIVKRLRSLILELAPWDYDSVSDMSYVKDDPYGWLVGAFPPTVRAAHGSLPSGRPVMPLGDTAITFDPIGGQGGNNASRHAAFVAECIIERGENRFDKQWMQKVSDDYWDLHGGYAYRFNNMFLEPPTAPLIELLQAAASDRKVAERLLVANIAEPRGFFPWIEDLDATRKTIHRIRDAENDLV